MHNQTLDAGVSDVDTIQELEQATATRVSAHNPQGRRGTRAVGAACRSVRGRGVLTVSM